MAYYSAIYKRTVHAAYLAYFDAYWIYETNNGRNFQTIGYAATEKEVITWATEQDVDVIFD